MRTVYDKFGNPLYAERSREEADIENQQDYIDNGGRPTYSIHSMEVPPSMRNQQEYRFNPERGRYKIFDKINNRFLDETPPQPEPESAPDFPVTVKRTMDTGDFPKTDRVNNRLEQTLQSGAMPVPRANRRPEEMQRVTRINAEGLEKRDLDMFDPDEFPKTNKSNGDQRIMATKMIRHFDGLPHPEDQQDVTDIVKALPNRAEPVEQAAKIKEAKDFLRVLSNREKSKSKYKK